LITINDHANMNTPAKKAAYPHICGSCKKGYRTDKEYCDHKCAATGFTPRDNEHQGEKFKAASEAALARGAARKK